MLKDSSLKTEIASLKLENPHILASGILDENGYTMKRILEDGAAAVVTKSIGMDERTGYLAPVIAEAPSGLINAIGLANPGIESFGEEIAIAKTANRPVIGSIFASTVEEFVDLAIRMHKYKADAIELNLSCPHVKGFGSEVGSDPDLVEQIVNELKLKLPVPIFAKLTPNVTNILDIAKAAHRADALVLINTVRAIRIDIHARMPVLSNIYGGLSGPAIKPIGLRAVYDVYRETGFNIIGVGGIETYEDVVEYIMAGARAVQIGTAMMRKGRKIFGELNSNLQQFMESEGFSSIDDMIGIGVVK